MTTGQTDTITPAPAADLGPVKARVVLVDTRPDRRAVMRQVFEHSGVAAAVVAEADSQSDAVTLVETHAADVAVIELPQPAKVGLETVAALRRRFADLAIVVISFNTDAAVKAEALAAGANAYLVKPVSAREVMAAVPDAPHPAATA